MRGVHLKRLMRKLGVLARQEQGNSATEYAVLLALIIIVASGSVESIGETFYELYVTIAETMPDVPT